MPLGKHCAGSGAHQQSGSQQGAETGKPLPKKGALQKERVMMKLVIILVVLLLLSFPTY